MWQCTVTCVHYALLNLIDYLYGLTLVLLCHRLREAGYNVRFITNTTKESKSSLMSRLTAMGFKVSPSQIFTCLTAARILIEKEKLIPYLMLEDSALEDFAGIECNSKEPSAVVVGVAPSMFDYQHLNKAFRLVAPNQICHILLSTCTYT